MRISTSLASAYAVDDPREGARWMVERARAARDAGLDGLWVGDHHATPVPYYQNGPILARLAAEWDDRPLGALYLLPLWHPVLVAEQIATVAAVAQGRFVLQCAVGGGGEQFAALGCRLGERVERFERGLDIVRRLLAGEVVDDPDGPWAVEGAQVSPRPAEPVEVWIGAAASAGIARAARLGDTWYGGPEMVDDVAAAKLDEYRSHATTEAPTLPLRRDVYVAADEADAARVREPITRDGYRGFDPAALVIGTASEVVDRFASLGEVGFTEIVVRQLAPDQGDALASIERLAGVRRQLAG